MTNQDNYLPQISQGELEVMKVLWQLGEASSGIIVQALLPKSSWKSKTIQTMLNRLVQKGAVSAEKGEGRNYCYRPLIGEDEYKLAASTHFVDKVYDGSLYHLVAGFVKTKKLSAEEIKSLRTILEEEEL